MKNSNILKITFCWTWEIDLMLPVSSSYETNSFQESFKIGCRLQPLLVKLLQFDPVTFLCVLFLLSNRGYVSLNLTSFCWIENSYRRPMDTRYLSTLNCYLSSPYSPPLYQLRYRRMLNAKIRPKYSSNHHC